MTDPNSIKTVTDLLHQELFPQPSDPPTPSEMIEQVMGVPIWLGRPTSDEPIPDDEAG